jgi:hypothetical protein
VGAGEVTKIAISSLYFCRKSLSQCYHMQRGKINMTYETQPSFADLGAYLKLRRGSQQLRQSPHHGLERVSRWIDTGKIWPWQTQEYPTKPAGKIEAESGYLAIEPCHSLGVALTPDFSCVANVTQGLIRRANVRKHADYWPVSSSVPRDRGHTGRHFSCGGFQERCRSQHQKHWAEERRFKRFSLK